MKLFYFLAGCFIAVLLMFHLFWDATYVVTVEGAMEGATHQLNVISYNIQYGKGQDGWVDIHRTIEKLKSIEADIICLQEVERYSFRSGFQDQVDLIAKELNMNAVFYPSIAYPGIYYGNAIFSKYPIHSSRFFPLTSQKENRSLILAEISLKNKQSIYVLNTHLGLNKEERGRDVKNILDIMAFIHAPLILMGDLNSTPEQQEFMLWNDHITKSNQGSKLQTYSHRDWQIDYIFFSAHFQVLNTSTYPSHVSDHYPIAATLQLK
ncbi:endonuclease/exonuclease/phosphatase family protein [Caldalkalibacillus mannanilyticus]|uniref:endonuclease/exonuclease/phosphatase family protein n=1 Tax=Caldalkalibacillus mannanilyticus TaxID=1418 RepID=UPI00046AAB52|nr:endonuclease/exonuclease/phosphatase family protein [Caldalkalibacillus mannanilyticus]